MPDAPEVKQIDGAIEAAKKRRTQYQETRITSKQSGVNPLFQELQKEYLVAATEADAATIRQRVLQRGIDQRRQLLDSLPDLEIKAGDLLTKVKQLESTDALLSENYQTMRIGEAAKISRVRVMSQAIASSHPVSPNVSKNIAVASLLGVLLALALAAVLEVFDDRIYSQSHIERLSNRPILAYIPAIRNQLPIISQSNKYVSSLLESMRLLRSNIGFASIDKPIKIIAVTSAGAGEGKSTTVVNLASVLAMDGKRVLILDADLRKPKIHTYFDEPRGNGFTNVITGSQRLADVIIISEIEGVSILPAGMLPPNPPEVLNSQASHRVIAELATMYDYILIDTPPTAGLSDVPVIAGQVDGILIVVAAQQTQRGQLQNAMLTLEQLDAPILGFVFNKITAKGGYRYSHYYYNYNYNYNYKDRADKE